MLLRVTVNYTVAGLLRFETRCGPVVIDTRGSTRFLRFSSGSGRITGRFKIRVKMGHKGEVSGK
jgi:hypothetical protein